MIMDKSIKSTRSINRFKTLEKDFISVHGDKYDYTDTVFSGVTVKVGIKCKLHDSVFYQRPINHLEGKGCPICGQEARVKARMKGKKHFVDKAKAIHKDLFDYTNVPENVKTDTKIVLSCSKHGEFITTFNQHVDNKKGCPQCGRDKGNINKRLTTEEFIERSKKVHGNKYDYSKTKYITQHDKVIIGCKEHGYFKQLPGNHCDKKQACPVCAGVGAFDLENTAYVYIIRFIEQNVFKVGITNNLKNRLSNYSGIEIIGTKEYKQGKDAKTEENRILNKYRFYKYKGKRFIERGFTELLVNLEKETLVNELKCK